MVLWSLQLRDILQVVKYLRSVTDILRRMRHRRRAGGAPVHGMFFRRTREHSRQGDRRHEEPDNRRAPNESQSSRRQEGLSRRPSIQRPLSEAGSG